MDQNIGKLLDNRYELLERIGTGGMAVVYKARCHRLNRLVAIKILKPDLAEDAEIRRRFRDESQAVAMLSHPNIMAVYDVSHSDDLNYIVMELLDGITLKQYMQKKGEPLNWREALHFITQIMKALSHAHSRGIIHRDIKPQNIMVLRDGSIRVTDFGIARLTSAAQATLTQEALGSVHYISPEQARGSRIDNRADIYSAGVVLYEMTSGRLPFEGDTPVAVAIQHINSIPLPPRDINPDIPEALEAINLKAMAHDMEKRYVSAEAMLADLEEFRKNPDVNFDYARDDFFEEELVDEPTLIRKTEDSGAIRSRRPGSEGEKDEKDRSGIWPTVLAIGAIIIFLGCIVYFLLSTVFGGILQDNSKELIVPNLIGMTVEEVNRDISEGKIDDIFTVMEGETVVSDLPVGQIVRQDPNPNERKKGEEIIITVDISAGPKQLQMPDLVNEEYRQARQVLQEQMKMKLITDYEHSEEVQQNYVIRTEPAEGVNLEPGQVVKIIISLGPKEELVSVPEFTSQSIEWAITQARKLGLVVGDVDEKRDSKNEKGTVIFQSVPAYTEVPKGTMISFHISSGPTNDNNPTGNPSDDPVVTTPSPVPTQQPVIATSKTVSIDLSGKTEPVSIRIEVGGNVQFSGTVDPSVVASPYVKTITGTGQQTINVYVDDVLVKSYTEKFN